jgi:hypothetical protein
MSVALVVLGEVRANDESWEGMERPPGGAERLRTVLAHAEDGVWVTNPGQPHRDLEPGPPKRRWATALGTSWDATAAMSSPAATVTTARSVAAAALARR